MKVSFTWGWNDQPSESSYTIEGEITPPSSAAMKSVILHELHESYIVEHPERAFDVIQINIRTGEAKTVRPEDPDYPWRSLGEFDLRPNRFKGS